jgi:hypothetical protein
VDPRAGLDNVEKRKFLPLQGLELRPLVRQPVASRYTDYDIPAPSLCTVGLIISQTTLVMSLMLIHLALYGLIKNSFV